MKRFLAGCVLLLAALSASSDDRPALAPQGVTTFSIVAMDPANGDLGVAVASRYFSVGSVVPWALAGVGAVATQANVNVGYGPRGIDLLREGLTAKQVLEKLLAEVGGRPPGENVVGAGEYPGRLAGSRSDGARVRSNARRARRKALRRAKRG